MINLLPSNEKNELAEIERQKIIAIIGVLIVFFITALSSILWVVSLNISSDKMREEVIAENEKQRLNNDNTNFVKIKIFNLNEKLLKIKDLIDNEAQPSEVIRKISKSIPPGIYLTSISYQGRQIAISGFAPTRDDLLSFKNNLESEERFENIDFPPINWVKPKAIKFTVTLNAK